MERYALGVGATMSKRPAPLVKRIAIVVIETDEGCDYELEPFCLACGRRFETLANPASLAEILKASRHHCKPTDVR